MPTGFTYPLSERDMTFRDFVLRCARGMGACIDFREDSLDDPLPETVPPMSDFYYNSVKEAEEDLKQARAMTIADAEKAIASDKARALKNAQAYVAERKKDQQRFKDMERQVLRWEPPTGDHEGLKRFMLEQLRPDAEEPQPYPIRTEYPTPIEYTAEMVDRAERTLASRKESLENAQKRVAERNQWLRDLRASLPLEASK